MTKINQNINKEIDSFYSDLNSETELKNIFKKAYFKFYDFHNNPKFKGEYDTLFCNIHTNFEEGHNCVACNLNVSNLRIENFLIGFNLYYDINTTFTTYI